jgi:hypothetical protein
VLSGCGLFGSPGESETVCAEGDRAVLVAEKLTRREPSMPFTVPEQGSVWAAVIADADFNPSAVVARVADLYVIAAGADPAIREDTNGLTVIDDPRLSYEREGQYRRLDVEPGRYQVWSTRGPEIEVVTCP